MNITIVEKQGRVNVTVLQLHEKLDGSNYKDLVAKAQELVQVGVMNILIDLTEVGFMSSAGMVALHSIAKLLKGKDLSNEEGWSLLHSVDRERDNGTHPHLKLFNPQPKVEQVLDVAGFSAMFEIFKDFDQAIASF